MSSDTDFVRMMTMLAVLSKTELSEDLFQFYYSELKPFGMERVILRMRELAKKTTQRTGMPTIQEISDVFSPTISKDDEARATASRIIGAISKFGSWGPLEAKEYIGDTGWEVVQRYGGWLAICNRSDDAELSVMEAQLREMCRITEVQQRPDHTALPASDPLKRALRIVASGDDPKGGGI